MVDLSVEMMLFVLVGIVGAFSFGGYRQRILCWLLPSTLSDLTDDVSAFRFNWYRQRICGKSLLMDTLVAI